MNIGYRPESDKSWRTLHVSSLFGTNRGDNSLIPALRGVMRQDFRIITSWADDPPATQLPIPLTSQVVSYNLLATLAPIWASHRWQSLLLS